MKHNTDRSHVGMGHMLCPVCGAQHDEVVLFDTRLRKTLERDNCMGYALCPEHAALEKEYIALVECDNAPQHGAKLTQASAHRTGVICHIRRTVAAQLFNTQLPPALPMVFVEVGVIAALQDRAAMDTAGAQNK